MKRGLAVELAVLTVAIALEMIFVPVDGVLASPPNAPQTNCPSAK